MTTLIVTSSRHGSTREIAERVADTLRSAQQVDTVVEDPAGAAPWLDTADAVIVAAPVYAGKLEAKAKAFLDSRRAELTDRALVLLVSGGSPVLDDRLRAQLEAYRPRELAYFQGALVEERLSGVEKLMLKVSKNDHYGDYRDWDAIGHWAGSLSGDGVR